MDIESNLAAYLGAREPTARYASFDYCFNYFRSFQETEDLESLVSGLNLQLSCLHLGFYLASWGMLRGSTQLLQRSVKHFEPVIEVIASARPEVWSIDADAYTDGNIEILLEVSRQLRAAFPEGASDILITKIMLGVFGSVPAFDTYFKKGFGVSTFGRKSLMRIGSFYRDNSEVIDRHRVPTLDFATGTMTERKYSRAKVIDMIFFVEGAAA